MREALRRLYQLGPGRMLSGRERLKRLLTSAGEPHVKTPSVLVGGTNGKGRAVAGLSAVLSSRYRTGAFLKPHLKSIRERWRINDQPVGESEFISATHDACDLIERHDEPISFFEANVLIGALLFERAGCEFAIWEVGLGGQHDACNLVEPQVSVLTNVGFDHQAILGDTLEAIARDKAHIARPGRQLILGAPRPGWELAYTTYFPVVAEVAGEIGAKLQALEPPTDTDWERWHGNPAAVPPDSAMLIRAVLAKLLPADSPLSETEITAGLERTHYPARLERTELRGRPVVLDAAHNVDSLKWLVEVLRRGALTPDNEQEVLRLPVLFGCQATRDPLELLRIIEPITATLVPVEIPVLRPCPLDRLAGAAGELSIKLSLPGELPAQPQGDTPEPGLGGVTELDPPDNSTGWLEGVEHALSLATPESPLLICGSIYYLGEILRVFE